MALCSLSTGNSVAPVLFSRAVISSPAQTRHSLFATAMIPPFFSDHCGGRLQAPRLLGQQFDISVGGEDAYVERVRVALQQVDGALTDGPG